jgi:hypothetical protein
LLGSESVFVRLTKRKCTENFLAIQCIPRVTGVKLTMVMVKLMLVKMDDGDGDSKTATQKNDWNKN